MTTHVNDAGTWRQLIQIAVNDEGTWRQIQEAYVNDAGTWRSVFAALSASAAPDTVSGSCQRTTAGSCSASTTDATVTATGGSGSYSYAWEYVSGTTASVNFPTAAVTNFTRSAAVADPPNVVSGVYRCLVTDTVTSATAYTNNVTVNTTHTLTV